MNFTLRRWCEHRRPKASLAMILHAVAANVRFGGRIWIYGGITEGIRGVIADLPKVRHYRTRLLSSIGILRRAPVNARV